jgi:hypothetical protein
MHHHHFISSPANLKPKCSSSSSIQTSTIIHHPSTHYITRLLNLIRHPPKQRLTLPILPIRLRIRHLPPLPLPNLLDPPRPLVARLLKELQVLIEAASAGLRHVHIRPDSSEEVGSGKDGEELVGEVVEEDRGEEGDGEVGQAPDYHADGGALGAGGGGVDFGGDEPGGCEPGYAKGGGCEEEGL